MEPPNNDMPKLINFLRTNGYQLQQVQYNPQRGATARAIFQKTTHIEELDGNDINGATINITIDFDRMFDYRYATIDQEEEVVNYNVYTEDRGRQFIEQLIDQTYDSAPVVVPVPQGAPSNGGKRKGRKTKRRTRKNRRK